MTERDARPAAPVRTAGRVILTLVAVLAAASGIVTLSAVGSLVAEEFPVGPAAAAVLVGAVGLSVIVPLGLAATVVRAMKARAMAPRRPAVFAGSIVALNLAIVVLTQVLSPVPLVRLLPQRGTWAFDAIAGNGPFGPAAVPIVTRRVEELRGTATLDGAAPLWCDETAASVGYGIATGLRDGAPAPLADTLANVLARHGIDLATGAIPTGVDGRALLRDVVDVGQAIAPVVPLPPFPEAEPTVRTVESRRIVFDTPGWEARYEDGAWRICTDSPSAAVLAGRDLARSMRDAAAKVPSVAVRMAGPWDPEVRAALRGASYGRAAFHAGVSGLDPAWPESLTRAAAAAQAERVRGWCVPAAVGDPTRSAALSALSVRWGVGAPGTPIDPAARSLVDLQGRKYLDDVLAACGPVAQDRQATEAARGLPVQDSERRRWAELESSAVGAAAMLVEDGTGGVRIEVGGRALRAVQEDGGWRIDWRD
jgi:hypothetical protein